MYNFGLAWKESASFWEPIYLTTLYRGGKKGADQGEGVPHLRHRLFCGTVERHKK